MYKLLKFLSLRKNKVDNVNDFKFYKGKYLEILTKIEGLLENGNHIGQANVVRGAIDKLTCNAYEEFLNMIQGVNFWGGVGAVWEVYFENKKLRMAFNKNIAELIKLMNNTSISNSRIISFEDFFRNNY